MYRLQATKKFKKGFQKLEKSDQKAAEKALKQLAKNPRHPSLRVKKMKGSQNDIWEASANMDIRITFHFQSPDIMVLRNCGHHDPTLKNP